MADLSESRTLLPDPGHFVASLVRLLRTRPLDSEALAEELNCFGFSVPYEECASETLVEGLVALLENGTFLALETSYVLPHWLQEEWEWFDGPQQGRLRKALLSAFDRFGDPTGAFASAEVLGQACCDWQALAELNGLTERARLPARALVAHGFECLARETDDGQLRTAAIEALRGLAQSPSAQIADEAKQSLRLLERRGVV